MTPVPPAWFEANEPCAACRPLAIQAAYLKYYVKSLQTTFADVERAAAKAFDRQIEAQVAANEAKQASQKDVRDVKKFQEAEDAKKDAKDLQEQFRKLKGQLDVLEQTLAGASALLKKLEEELEACRKQQCPPREPSTAQPPATPATPETPKKRIVCVKCESNAWKLEGLETDLRVKQRVRLALKTTMDTYGKHKDDGTLSPVNQISVNDAEERLPEVERQIRELEAKIRDARTALETCVTGKCTDKPVATDKTTPPGKTEQRRTERKTEERKTEQRKTEERKTDERKTEERKTEERRTPKKETGRATLKSGETTSAPRISVTIGLGGSSDRGHRHENRHPGGGDGGGRGGGGFGFGGSSPGAISFGR